jgi:hypothetical protein
MLNDWLYIQKFILFQWLDSPLEAKAASVFEASRSHSLDTPHSVGLLWTRDQPVAETSTWQHNTNRRQTSMPPAGFEATIPVSGLPQTHALDRAATGIG